MRALPGRHFFAASVAVGALALVAAACGGGSSTTSTSGTTAGAAGGQAVTATLTEFKIALSSTTLTPGTYTFDAVNAGTITHALEINGPGVTEKATGDIASGASSDLTVTLQAGTYDVFCPVGDHKQLGMDVQLTVGAGGGSAATSPTTAAASTAPTTGAATTTPPTTAPSSGAGY